MKKDVSMDIGSVDHKKSKDIAEKNLSIGGCYLKDPGGCIVHWECTMRWI